MHIGLINFYSALVKEFNNKEKDVEKKYICSGYCGISCVDGSCPKANQDEYAERGYDVVRKCEDCSFYKGCKDCCFKDTNMCIAEI